jgi:hypothetical protein
MMPAPPSTPFTFPSLMSLLAPNTAMTYWLLAIFGETGLFGGLATFSCPR